MEAGKKVTRQTVLDTELDDKLNQDAERESRKLSPHISHIIKQHIAKVELDKPFVPKKQYSEK